MRAHQSAATPEATPDLGVTNARGIDSNGGIVFHSTTAYRSYRTTDSPISQLSTFACQPKFWHTSISRELTTGDQQPNELPGAGAWDKLK